MNDARTNARQFVGEIEDGDIKTESINNNNNEGNIRGRSRQRSRSSSRGKYLCLM
jgi:hypothetical protein